MLEEIINSVGPKVSRQKALEMLGAEAEASWRSEWYLLPFLAVGYIATTYSADPLSAFLSLAMCLAAVEYRNRRKRAAIATAVLSLNAEDSAESKLGPS